MAQQPMQGQPVVPGQAMPDTTLPADNLGLAGFICGIIGFLCCSFCTIPGLICSIMSMNNVKSGKVNPKNKWMGIVGLVLSILGVANMWQAVFADVGTTLITILNTIRILK